MSNKKENAGEFSIIFSGDPSIEDTLTKPINSIELQQMLTKFEPLAQIKILMEEGVKAAGHNGLKLELKKIEKGSVVFELAGQIIFSGAPIVGSILWGPICLYLGANISLMDIITHFLYYQRNNLSKSNIPDFITKYFDDNPKVGETIKILVKNKWGISFTGKDGKSRAVFLESTKKIEAGKSLKKTTLPQKKKK